MKDLADVTADLMVDSAFSVSCGESPHAAYFGVSGVFGAHIPNELKNLRQNAYVLFNDPKHRAAFAQRIRQAMLANNDFAKDVLEILRCERYVTDGRLMNEVYLETSESQVSSDGGNSTRDVILAVAGVLLIVLCTCKNIFGG